MDVDLKDAHAAFQKMTVLQFILLYMQSLNMAHLERIICYILTYYTGMEQTKNKSDSGIRKEGVHDLRFWRSDRSLQGLQEVRRFRCMYET